jgi:hypothetical protein
VMAALTWGIAWMLLALQFNQNFLRIPIFVDAGVLMCCLSVRTGRRPLPQIKDAVAPPLLQAPPSPLLPSE